MTSLDMELEQTARGAAPAGDGPDIMESKPNGDLGIVPGLVWAFRIHDDGKADALDINLPIEPGHDGWLWLHFNLSDVRGNAWLTSADIPVAARNLLLSPDNFQQLHATESCIYGVLADLVRQLDRSSSEIGYLRFAMSEKLLLSGRHHPLCAVEATRKAIEDGRRLPNVAGLLEMIVEQVALAIDRTAEQLSIEIDKIEEEILGDKLADHRIKLGRLRRTSVRIHRQLMGMRSLFHRLEHEDTGGLKPPLKLAAAKLAQRLDGLDHDIVELRDRATLLQEEISIKVAEQTNSHLHALTILTILFLPPTLITGIFGMNTKGLPFTEMEDAFLWASLLMIVSSAGVVLLMRRIGILRL
jgi:zinc transporter